MSPLNLQALRRQLRGVLSIRAVTEGAERKKWDRHAEVAARYVREAEAKQRQAREARP